MKWLNTLAALAVVASCWPCAALAGDREIAQAIGANLRDSGQLVDYNIAVKYKDGTAWLSGHVSDRKQMATALALTREMSHVKKVKNLLSLGDEPSPSNIASSRQSSTGRRPGFPVRQASAEDSSVDYGMPSRRPARQPAKRGMGPRPIRRVSADCPIPGAGMDEVMDGDGGMPGGMNSGRPLPAYAGLPGAQSPAKYDQANMPNYAWPSYAAHPNYAAVTYPKQYSPTAWPFIGPFYPYPQVPLGWRKVTLEWDDGWWFLDFKDDPSSCW